MGPDPATGKLVTTLRDQDWVSAVCPVTVNGRDLLASGSDETVQIWNAATGEPATTLHTHRSWIGSVCTVTVNGQDLLASDSSDETVRIWNPATC